MTPDPRDAFLAELARMELVAEQAAEVLAEAEEMYAPAPLALPAGREFPVPMPGAGLVRLVRDEPDKLVTHPIWFAITTAMHLLVAVVTLGVFVAATTILVLLARLIEPVRFLPVLQFSAVCVGLLASGGSLAGVWRSYRAQLKSCPW